MSAARAQDVLDFWFGAGDSPELLAVRDEDLARRFLALTEAAARGDLDSWCGSPRRQLALILLLDTLPRHIWRGTARACAQDDKALAVTLQGLQQGADATLTVLERWFYYLPLTRCESAAIQEEAVAAFRRLPEESSDTCRPMLQSALQHAIDQAQIIQRFGRFPQRNALLGRRSTGVEQQWLREQAHVSPP